MSAALFSQMAAAMELPKGDAETPEAWKRRVLYSAVALQMLAALYDYDDTAADGNEGTVSMQHVLLRGTELFASFAQLYGDEYDMRGLVSDMRGTYQKTGFMLHRANRLAAPPSACAQIGNVYALRGHAPWAVSRMSGIGTFSASPSGPDNTVLEEMFFFQNGPIADWWAAFLGRIQWQDDPESPSDVEYLDVGRGIGGKYWSPIPPREGIALCRAARGGIRQYTLLRLNAAERVRCNLPNWQTEKGGYLPIALALRQAAGVPPTLRVQCDGPIITLRPDYLLPPHEQNFVRLCTWPLWGNSLWERVIAADVGPAVIDIYRRMGFKIEEDNTNANGAKRS